MAKRRRIRKPYVFTPSRKAALDKARAVRSANAKNKRKAKAGSSRRLYSSNPITRGQGISGAKKNFIPYARVNQRSQTAGFNVGTIIPGTGKRVVSGGYIRLENVKKGGVITNALNSHVPKGSLLGKGRKYFNENVTVTKPALRADVGGSQVRLGTSRSGGATVTVRRGRHKVPAKNSRKGMKEFDIAMHKIRTRDLKRARLARRELKPRRRGVGLN